MLNVAIVGAGTMGKVHSNAYLNVKNAKVVAVCDLEIEKASVLASAHGAKSYRDFDEMLNREEIDIMDICLPTYLHREYSLKAIDRNKHVFCEKPVALNKADAEEMIVRAEERKVKFAVGHVVRFFPAYMNAVESIKEGKIGTPKLIRTTRNGAYPSWSWQDWYSDYRLSGGPILDLVIHDIDWIRHNFGDVERVYAKSLSGRKTEKQDHCLITLRLKNGAIAHIEGSWAYPAGSIFGTTLEVIGTKGQIEADSRESAPIKKHLAVENSSKIAIESPLSGNSEPYAAELQDFVDSIIEGREPSVTGSEAVKALEISLAAIKSVQTGEAVVLGGDRR